MLLTTPSSSKLQLAPVEVLREAGKIIGKMIEKRQEEIRAKIEGNRRHDGNPVLMKRRVCAGTRQAP